MYSGLKLTSRPSLCSSALHHLHQTKHLAGFFASSALCVSLGEAAICHFLQNNWQHIAIEAFEIGFGFMHAVHMAAAHILHSNHQATLANFKWTALGSIQQCAVLAQVTVRSQAQSSLAICHSLYIISFVLFHSYAVEAKKGIILCGLACLQLGVAKVRGVCIHHRGCSCDIPCNKMKLAAMVQSLTAASPDYFEALPVNNATALHVYIAKPVQLNGCPSPLTQPPCPHPPDLPSMALQGVIASEEEDEPVAVEETYSGNYVVVFDPLDGSSNIDAGISTGSIFGVYAPSEECKLDDMDDPNRMMENCLVNTCQPGAHPSFSVPLCTFSAQWYLCHLGSRLWGRTQTP